MVYGVLYFIGLWREKRAAISRFCCENNRDKASSLYYADIPFSLPACAQEIASSSALYAILRLEHLLHTHKHLRRVPSITSFYLFFSHSLNNPFTQPFPSSNVEHFCFTFFVVDVAKNTAKSFLFIRMLLPFRLMVCYVIFSVSSFGMAVIFVQFEVRKCYRLTYECFKLHENFV